MLSTRSRLGIGLVLAAIAAGCQKPEPPPIVEQPRKNYFRQVGPGEVALVKITDPSQYPDFREGFERQKNLELACQYSLEYLSRPSSQQYFPYLDITHERAVASIHAFLECLRTARTAEEFDQMIKTRFEVYKSRGCDDMGTVLYTGYYRPIFDARLQPDHEYRYPLYKRPPDLEQDPVTLQNRRAGGGPYYTRADIEGGVLAGQGLELCYLKDRFEAYIVTVQGSGRLRLEDGSFFDIGYAGDNGHEYKSIGQAMVESGEIDPSQLSLQGLIRYFRDHPDRLEPALSVNNRYVFFTPRGGGPYGSLNVPVSPFRSIATDKQVYPRACIAYLQTQLPARTPQGDIINHSYSGFALDQDTGGAIRAAGRCDVFMGTGPEVGELAGRTFAEGQMYYIAVREGAGPTMTDQMASPAPGGHMSAPMPSDGFVEDVPPNH